MAKLVFISYSHRDERWRDELTVQLAPYLQDGSIPSISAWSDEQIEPASDWLREIQAALMAAKAAVLLVTSDFLASEFILEQELPPLLIAAKAGRVKILWIHVRASAYHRSPLRHYQAVIEPDKPLAEMTRPDREKAWVRICKAIEKAVGEGEGGEAVENPPPVQPDEGGADVIIFHKATKLLRDLEESIQNGRLRESIFGPIVLEELKRRPTAKLVEPYDLHWIVDGIRMSDYYFNLVRPSAEQLDWNWDVVQTVAPILVGVARTLEPSPEARSLLKRLCDAIADQQELQVVWPKAGAFKDTINTLYDACQRATELANDDVLAELKGLTVVGRY